MSIKKTATGYRVRWRTPQGERSKSVARWSDAKALQARVIHEMETGTYVDPGAGKVTLRDYAEGWRASQVHRATTAAQVETNFRLHLYPVLGDRPLKAIKPSEVQAWVKGLTHSLAPATVEVVYRYMASVCRAAVADKLIPSSPCTGTKLPKQEKKQVVPLAPEAVERLIDMVPVRYRALVVLGAGTGLRQGEAFGLTWDGVDFLRRTLTVDRQLVLMPGSAPAQAPPKTLASTRTIPLPNVVLQALAAHRAAFEPGPWGLVFTNGKGEPIRRNRFSESIWRPAVKAAGLPKDSGFHDLRHYYASLLIRHGESVKVVQARLGHASASETLDTYSHMWPDSDDRTREAVDAVLGHRVSDEVSEVEA